MLIRRPTSEVFSASAQPETITKFWLKSTTGPLLEGAGFRGENEVDQVLDATEGFSIVLCDLKTLLESGRSANLVKDKAELIQRSMAGA